MYSGKLWVIKSRFLEYLEHAAFSCGSNELLFTAGQKVTKNPAAQQKNMTNAPGKMAVPAGHPARWQGGRNRYL